jgi:hypothetical protein
MAIVILVQSLRTFIINWQFTHPGRVKHCIQIQIKRIRLRAPSHIIRQMSNSGLLGFITPPPGRGKRRSEGWGGGNRPKVDSKRQKNLAVQADNREKKLADLCAAPNCVWATSTRGGLQKWNNDNNHGESCCAKECMATYFPEGHVDTSHLVMSLRKYYKTKLDKQSRREYQCQRVLFRGHDCDVGVDLRRKKLFKFYLEDPTELFVRLGNVEAGITNGLPPPDPHGARRVCARFFNFATGAHNDTRCQQATRKEAGVVFDAAILDLHSPQAPNRKPERAYPQPKYQRVRHFLRNAADAGLQMPNDDLRILPWNSVMSAHAAYARDEEVRLGVPVAAYEHGVGRLPDLEDARYGNRLLGAKVDFASHSEIASLTYFRAVWSQDHKQGKYTIRRWLPFAKCTVCKKFKDNERLEKNSIARKDIQTAYDKHLREVKLERQHYYSNRLRSESDPATYLSLIIDGADQSDHQCPHWCERSHASAACTRQKLYLYGCIAHGRKAYVYTVPDHVKQGHDTTIEVIWRVLNDTLLREGKIPPVLLLQLDNTTKQNKGRFLFAFLGMLVHYGVVRKVVVSFLPVGHTVCAHTNNTLPLYVTEP